MRTVKHNLFPLIRQNYDNLEELGNVINKGVTATWQKLKGERQWKSREKEMIIDDLIRRGIEAERSPETFEKYFGRAT